MCRLGGTETAEAPKRCPGGTEAVGSPKRLVWRGREGAGGERLGGGHGPPKRLAWRVRFRGRGEDWTGGMGARFPFAGGFQVVIVANCLKTIDRINTSCYNPLETSFYSVSKGSVT